jgi:flagellar motor switch protein FliN/FliY
MADNEVANSGAKTSTPTPSVPVAPAAFPSFDGGAAAAAPKNIDFILDIPMQVTVQVGSTKMVIRELLQLGQGSVIELEKLAGEPMEVLVNQFQTINAQPLPAKAICNPANKTDEDPSAPMHTQHLEAYAARITSLKPAQPRRTPHVARPGHSARGRSG